MLYSLTFHGLNMTANLYASWLTINNEVKPKPRVCRSFKHINLCCITLLICCSILVKINFKQKLNLKQKAIITKVNGNTTERIVWKQTNKQDMDVQENSVKHCVISRMKRPDSNNCERKKQQ